MNELMIQEVDELLCVIKELWLNSSNELEAQCYMDSIDRLLDHRLNLMAKRRAQAVTNRMVFMGRN